MSWESSIAYERLISQEVRRRLGGNHSADLLIRSYDFTQIQALQQPAMRRRRLAAGGWRLYLPAPRRSADRALSDADISCLSAPPAAVAGHLPRLRLIVGTCG